MTAARRRPAKRPGKKPATIAFPGKEGQVGVVAFRAEAGERPARADVDGVCVGVRVDVFEVVSTVVDVDVDVEGDVDMDVVRTDGV